ncbi:MAG: hypothetical protein O3B72_10155 [Proteobacteria bacterium]|nr:hypothetical protein [Pseudomonadota bacterium]
MSERITSALTVTLLLLFSCVTPACLAEAPDASDFAGNRYCEACHVEATASFAGNVHASVLAGEPRGCETCHGPGRRHTLSMNARHIMNPGTSVGPAAIAACKQCHGGAPHPWDKGKADRQYHCVNCHSVHANRDDQ